MVERAREEVAHLVERARCLRSRTELLIQPVDGGGDLVQVGCDLRGDTDGEVFPVGEVNVYTLMFQFFGNYEQGIHLGGGIVPRFKGLAYMFRESPRPGKLQHHVVLFGDTQVFVERATSIGHPFTVNASAAVRTEAR